MQNVYVGNTIISGKMVLRKAAAVEMSRHFMLKMQKLTNRSKNKKGKCRHDPSMDGNGKRNVLSIGELNPGLQRDKLAY